MTDDDVVERVVGATDARLGSVELLDGGAVGTVRRVDLDDGRTVVGKTGDVPLTVEARMLRYLAAESDLPVPDVLDAADDLLLLEYVGGAGGVSPPVERHLADLLAALHDRTPAAVRDGPDDQFGFHYDTLGGALRQPNPWTDSWVEFVREFRLRHVADRAAADGRLPASLRERVDALAAALDALLVEPAAPRLLHGDVWTGNLVVDGDRVAAVLDPAVFYGHAEYDLAYALWTDTVGEPFLRRYRQHRGLAEGFDERRRVYEVVPLLEHVWHFGATYHGALRERLTALGY